VEDRLRGCRRIKIRDPRRLSKHHGDRGHSHSRDGLLRVRSRCGHCDTVLRKTSQEVPFRQLDSDPRRPSARRSP
jgi:hypothetical protein